MASNSNVGTTWTSSTGVPQTFYQYPQRLQAKQEDPSGMDFTLQKQDYSVIIRKKQFYVSRGDQGGYQNDWFEVYQVNNFINASTSLSVETGSPGRLSLTVRGGEKVVVAPKQTTEDKGYHNFSDLLSSWNALNATDPNAQTVDYTDIMNLRLNKYGWAYAEKCNWQPMDEIYVFSYNINLLKGGPKGTTPPKPELVFFGYIDSVVKQYQAGTGGLAISITASDQLKILQISYLAVSAPFDLATGGASVSYDRYGNMIVNSNNDVNKSIAINGIFSGMYANEVIVNNCQLAGINDMFLQDRIEKIERIPFLPNLQKNQDSLGTMYIGQFSNRLSYCQNAAQTCNLEFFADEEGKIVFKIPTFTVGINRQPANNLGYAYQRVDPTVSPFNNTPVSTYQKSNNASSSSSSAPATTTTTTTEQYTYYTVKGGDNLWDIAGSILGNPTLWRTHIYNYNTDKIKDPHWIYPGQVLKILNPHTVKTTVAQQSVPQKVQLQPNNNTSGLNINVSLAAMNDDKIPVIPSSLIISFTFQDSDQGIYTFAQVTPETTEMSDPQYNQIQTRAVQDYDLIRQFGFRPMPAVNTPLVGGDVGAELYAGMLLMKSIMNRYTGTLTMIETPEVKVGQPIRFHIYDEYPFPAMINTDDPAQAVFYVSAIQRTINTAGQQSTMSLTLTAGRVMGMPCIYDQAPELYRYFYDDGSGSIPNTIVVSKTVPAPQAPAQTAPPASKATYTVQSGDTLWDIAGKFYSGNNSKYSQIMSDNNIANPHLLYPGQVLTINNPTSGT